MFLEILIAIWIQMVGAIGVIPSIIVSVLAVIIAFVLAHRVALSMAEAIFSPAPSRTTRSLVDPETERRSRQKKIRDMNDDELGHWLGEHPADTVALTEKCRRLRDRQDWAALALVMERLLPLLSGRPVDEIAMVHHQLADLYTGPLSKPERAREILNGFVMRFPKTAEASMMRERLANMTAQETSSV